MPANRSARLWYVHDPMCSWCWAFRPVWLTISESLPAEIQPGRLLGGLAPDSDQPMPMVMQQKLQAIWHTIQKRVPGTRFNFNFWSHCHPRRSTYPACRAVIAARAQDPGLEEAMILAIQQAYYLQEKNPSDDNTLIGLALEIGADGEQFSRALNAESTRRHLMEEIRQGQVLGARGFPSLVLERDGISRVLDYSYTDPDVVLQQLSL